MGKLIALGTVHGAVGFPFFATCLYSYLSGCTLCSIEVPDEEVSDYDVYSLIQKVNKLIISLIIESNMSVNIVYHYFHSDKGG